MLAKVALLPSVLTAALLALGCEPAKPPAPPPPPPPRVVLAAELGRALEAEATDPLAAAGYLDAIDRAVAQPDDPWAGATVAAALDALVWRRVADLPSGIEHAMVYRDQGRLVEVSGRLGQSWARGAHAPLLGGLIANALHDLALRVGAAKEAALWRTRAGCVPVATVAGPLAWPPLASLDAPSPVPPDGPLPAALPGVPPFASRPALEQVPADGCNLDLDATGSLAGLRAVVLDVVVPAPQWIYVGLASISAARVDVGGRPLLRRPVDMGDEMAYQVGVAEVRPGRLRLVVRVAQEQTGREVLLTVLGQDGAPLTTAAPRAGEVADPNLVVRAHALRLVPAAETAAELPLAAAALLAIGHDRAAGQLFEGEPAPKVGQGEPAVELLRLRAWQAAHDVPESQLVARKWAAAGSLLERCPACWEARLVAAGAAQVRKGYETGAFDALAALGVASGATGWERDRTAPELVLAASLASRNDLRDVGRRAYDALVRKAPGSALLADLDAQIHRRTGENLVEAACRGGLSRAAPACLYAHLDRADLGAALDELARLRRLRGGPACYRELELRQLLLYGQLERARLLYEALPAAQRPLALLGVEVGTAGAREAAARFERDMLAASGAPYAFEPLGRLLGVVDDPAPALERQGALLVAQDRREAFSPGAATAVLRHLERYRLTDAGLLYFSSYDLRRVGGTTDVAQGAATREPEVLGRGMSRILRRRIHKPDGRVLDPDPKARGAQGNTELSQLEKGDYVEVIGEGWGLPEDYGHLVVDSPDVMPPRTSVRQAEIELRRPRSIPLKVWSHALWGPAQSHTDAGDVVTRWQLADQAPRRLEEGVPPLEARVAISFGTDDWERIGRAIGEELRRVDERDPYVKRWVDAALGEGAAALDARARVARLTAAVGKAVRRGDPSALSDFVASWGGGGQRETARQILERGSGSRSWVLYRALREAGLESRIAVAETEPFSAAPEFPPHTGRFVHPLVQVRAGDDWLWIDADVDGPPLPPGRISTELGGRLALLTTGELVTVEGTTGEDQDLVRIDLRVDGKGDATGTMEAVIHGRAAQQLAERFEVTVGSGRTDLLRNVVLGWLPWADVAKVSLSSDEASWRIAVAAEIAVVGFAQPEDRGGKTWSVPGIVAVHTLYPRPTASTLGARYAAQADRSAALAIDQPLRYRIERRIELPAGAEVLRLPEPFALESERVRGRRTVGRDGVVLTDGFELSLPVATVATESFDAFVAAVRRIDDGFAHGTRIRLPAAKR